MKVYIAGPMAGIPEFNYPKFFDAEDALMSAGFSTVNPAAMQDEGLDQDRLFEVNEVDATVGPLARAAYLKRDIEALAGCDAIALLDEWEESVGANVELFTAHAIGLEVYRLEGDGPVFVLSAAPRLRPLFTALYWHIEAVQTEMQG